jgi:hypothetical protein
LKGFVQNLTEIVGGALAGCALGALMVFASLQVIYQIPMSIGYFLSVVIICVSSITPAAIAGVVFWKRRMALFSVAMIVTSVVVIYWIWDFVLGLFGTYL